MKPLMRQQSMIAELAGATVRKGIVSAGELDTSDVEVSSNSCRREPCPLEQSFPTRMSKMSSVVLVLAFLEMQKASQSAFLVAVGTSLSKRTSLKKLLEFMVMTNYQQPFQRWWDSRWVDSDSKLRRQVRTIAEGAGLTEIITYALTTPEKQLSLQLQPSNLTELMWPMTVDRSVLRQNMVSGILDTVAYNVARKNKNLALWDWKVFEQTGNPKEDLPNEINSFAFALTGLVAEKTSKLQLFQLTSSMQKESLKPSLLAWVLMWLIQQHKKSRVSTQVGQPWSHWVTKWLGSWDKSIL